MSSTDSPNNELLAHVRGPRDLFGGEVWAEVLRLAYGFEVARLGESGGQALEVPYVVLGEVARQRVVSLPFVDYLPIQTAHEAQAALDALRVAHPGLPVLLKTTVASADAEQLEGATVARRAVTHVVVGGEARVEAHPKFLANARRATRDGVEVRRSTESEALQRFYELYCRLRVGKFKSIPQPYSFFEAVHELFMRQGEGFLLEAWHQGEVVASIVVLQVGERWYYKFGASNLAALKLRANNALFAHLLDALDAGEYAALDLGLSGTSPAYAGLRRFKESLGGQEVPITYFQHVPPGYDDTTRTAVNAALGEVVAKAIAADLSPQQLSKLSEAMYVHFA